MAERLDGVTRAHERFEKSDLERRADRQRAELLQQFLHFGGLAQVAARDVMASTSCAIFLQASRVRLFVDAINRWRVQAHQARRDGFVGQQHVFLDQLVRHVVLVFLDAQDFSLLVQPDFRFGKIQFERTGLETRAADLLREFVRLMQHLLNRIVRRRALQNLQHLARR